MTAICLFSPVYTENAFILSKQMSIPILEKLEPNHTILLFGSARDAKQCLEFALKNPVQYIILNGENMTSKYYDKTDIQGKYYIFLQKKYPTFHYSPYIGEQCRLLGLKTEGLYDFQFIERENKGGIDLLFYGFESPLRKSIEDMLRQKYSDKKIIFAYQVYDNELIKLLVQATHVLNIPYFERSALEIHRINQALACGCHVFSKKSKCEYLNDKYKNKITFVEEYNDILL